MPQVSRDVRTTMNIQQTKLDIDEALGQRNSFNLLTPGSIGKVTVRRIQAVSDGFTCLSQVHSPEPFASTRAASR